MTFRIVERQEAVENVLSAFNWYQSEEDGLRFEFLQSSDGFYNTLERNLEAYSYIDKPSPRKTSTFSVCCCFEVQERTVVIFKVSNTHTTFQKSSRHKILRTSTQFFVPHIHYWMA